MLALRAAAAPLGWGCNANRVVAGLADHVTLIGLKPEGVFRITKHRPTATLGGRNSKHTRANDSSPGVSP